MEALKIKQPTVQNEMRDFILEQDHPCLMAQSVFKTDNVIIKEYSTFDSILTANYLIRDLKNYLEGYDFESKDNRTFIAVFPEVSFRDEVEFENRLWLLLQLIHHYDEKDWDKSVDVDPKSENFSFSILGNAFYLVGMHPGSSRAARQSPYPAIAFNLHLQFEKLREMGVYESVRDSIRQRDEAKNGSINPMLQDFGHSSEARQYSGRAVGKEWKCPFLHQKK